MIKVYVPGPYNIPIWRQFQSHETIWGTTQFVFDENDDYDCVAVIDGISKSIETTCPKENRFFWTGEPPMVKRYTKAFLNQFGHVFSCQENLVSKINANISNPPLPWMLGCSLQKGTHSFDGNSYWRYQDFESFNEDKIERLDKVCILTSNKTITKGHRDRVKFVERILKDKLDFIDVFGNGYNAVDDKLDVLSRYKYSIVIENCQYPNYWTEKLADCILAGCCPIYYGASNINEYFPAGDIPTIDILDYAKSIEKVTNLVQLNYYDVFYQNKRKYLDLILNDYNMFAMIDRVVSKTKISLLGKKSSLDTIVPMKYSLIDKGLSRFHRMFNI